MHGTVKKLTHTDNGSNWGVRAQPTEHRGNNKYNHVVANLVNILQAASSAATLHGT